MVDVVTGRVAGAGFDVKWLRRDCINMYDRYTTNIYGYWQFTDVLGLSCGIERYDLVYVFAVIDEKVQALNEKGKVISFHKTNITKNYFERPSYEYHKKCSLGTKSSQFYGTMHNSERHKNDCHRCQMHKFKKTVKKFKTRQGK